MAFRVLKPAEPEPQGGFRVIVPAPTGKPKGYRPLEALAGAAANLNRGLGVGDELVAAAGTVADIVRGKRRPTVDPKTGKIKPVDIVAAFRENMATQRDIEDRFAREAPIIAPLARGTGMAATALVPMGAATAPSRLAAAGQGAVSAGLSGGAYALADRGTLDERLDTANATIPVAVGTGAALGLFGHALASRARRRADTDAEVAARVLRRSRPDADQMASEAAAMREVGVDPTGIDVIGQRGRRLVRATGVKTDTAGETLTDNALRRSAATKPAVMSRTRQLSPDPRTASQLADDLRLERSEAAANQYRQPYQTPIQVDADTAAALRGDPGRAAIMRARQGAIARQDYAQAQELDGLLAQNMDELPTVSAGTLDRIRIAMGERAETASRRGARDISSGLFGRAGSIDRQLDDVPQLDAARANFRDTTRAIEVADDIDRLDVFSTDPADYARWLDSLPDQARQANVVAIRQEVLDALGGKRASTFGKLDDLATSPYARENLTAALGPDAAEAYLGNIAARLRQTRNATFVTPEAGARTAVLQNDIGEAGENAITALTATQQGLRGDVLAFIRTAADWWRRRGVTPSQAEALARVTVDPAQLDDLIAALRQAEGDASANALLQRMMQAANDAGPADPVAQSVREAVSAQLSRGAGARALGVGTAGAMPRE